VIASVLLLEPAPFPGNSVAVPLVSCGAPLPHSPFPLPLPPLPSLSPPLPSPPPPPPSLPPPLPSPAESSPGPQVVPGQGLGVGALTAAALPGPTTLVTASSPPSSTRTGTTAGRRTACTRSSRRIKPNPSLGLQWKYYGNPWEEGYVEPTHNGDISPEFKTVEDYQREMME